MATTSDRLDRTQESSATDAPGAEADKPSEIPPKGWLQVAKRGLKEAKVDQVPLLAAGVAFFAFLSLFPALAALVSVYGLVANPATVAQQVSNLSKSLPSGAGSLISQQVTTLTKTPAKSLGFSLIVSILLALWSASGGVGQLMTAINTAYDEEEKRSFLKKRGMALLLTLAAIVFMVIVIGLVAVAPALLGTFTSGPVKWLLEAARWIVLILLVALALAVLYRLAPDRDAPKVRWVSVGAGVATLLWVIASIGFTIYVSSFGSYAKTYGAFAGVAVLLLWFWITCYAILLGAEINAESEEQTVKDTTKGPPQPMGQRDAVKADSPPPDA